MLKRQAAWAGCALTLVTSACATTTTSSPEARTVIDQAVARCTASVLTGALLGAIVGNNSGQGNAGRGALTGAAAGGAVCAVIMAAAQRKAELIESQRAAVEAGELRRFEFETEEGARMALNTQVEAAEPAPAVEGAPARECRAATSSVETTGGAAPVKGAGWFCKGDDGRWTPVQATLECRYAVSAIEAPGMPTQALGRQRFCKSAEGRWELA